MKRLVGRIGWACLAAAWCFAAGEFALGGQARRAPASELEEKLAAMSIEELRAYQSYYYVGGGRDPMTMRLPTSAELGLDKKGKDAKVAPTLEEMERYMTEALANLTRALKEKNYEEAIRVGEEAVRVIDEDWPPLKADPPHLIRMSEEIRSHLRLAIRLKIQQDIQKEFDAMHIRVEGVLWSPADSRAVVNGKLLAAGEVMLNERRQGDLRVDMIEENGVVFQFKGMRFRIPVEVYAPQK